MSDVPSYNSSHRALLQAFFSTPVMTLSTARPLLAAILTAHDERETHPNDITLPDFTAYVHSLNAALSPFSPKMAASSIRNPSQLLSQNSLALPMEKPARRTRKCATN